MTTYLEDESSVEDGQPREGIEIRYGLILHRIAMGSRDRIIAGNRYYAVSSERSDVRVTTTDGDADLDLRLPVKHEFAQRYIASPPDDISVTVRRLQLSSGAFEQYWSGVVTGLDVVKHVATFKCEGRLSIALDRRIPTGGCSRRCTRKLFDNKCRVPIGPNRITTTVASHDGRTVVLASIDGKPSHWAKFGHLLHVASGERMSVIDQVGTTVTLHRPLFPLRNLHSVQLFRGCAHDIETCRDDFENVVNFGGFPELPRGNVWLPGGYGVFQQDPGE